MAKTRKITATFEDGTTIQRTTNRVYTHAVTDGYETNWCGRPDLMLKAKSKLSVSFVYLDGTKKTREVKVAKVTNDPWNFQKLH
jgi:hypothetical protein